MSQGSDYGSVKASPVKDFFVTMLTRDIELSDAILDLLDNCVDGILRNELANSSDKETPYDGFYAKITFDESDFMIQDNCGGIPWANSDYAFRMGKPRGRVAVDPSTVGTYGIGMKRAIFKIGRECLISTRNGEDAYDVEVSSAWMRNQDDWDLPASKSKTKFKDDGTTILVSQLIGEVKAAFGTGSAAFFAELEKKIRSHYSVIINKGFKVTVNGKVIKPKPVELAFSQGGKGKNGIRPFIYQATHDGVSVFLTVGLTAPIPDESELDSEQEGRRYSAEDAGWTIICNDRVVVHCDRTELTGWGEAGVPRFHNQFIAISGSVEFKATDPRKLPTTTTKRGIDASSLLYLRVKNKMREGMELFTKYTYRWKTQTKEAKKQVEEATKMPITALKNEVKGLSLRKLKDGGQQYKPVLPVPAKSESDMRLVSFRRKSKEIAEVADHLFDDSTKPPSEVGEECFNLILERARK